MSIKATLIRDRLHPNDFRVEALDDEGGIEVSIFSGPNALDRAITFAGSEYYEGWEDPDGLAGY